MSNDPIQNLLREADRVPAGAHRSDASLAEHVIASSKRRRRIRVSATLVAGLGIVIAAGWAINRGEKAAVPTVRVVAVDAKVAVAQLDEQIAVKELEVRMLLAQERISLANERLAAAGSTRPEDGLIERAASTLVAQADRVRRETMQVDAAAEVYREVIQHFPQTSSATLAKNRLMEIEKAG